MPSKRPIQNRTPISFKPLIQLLTETPIMAPLAAGAALLYTECVSDTQLFVTRGLSHSNDDAGDTSGYGSKDAWLFAPIAIFVLILISLLWYVCNMDTIVAF